VVGITPGGASLAPTKSKMGMAMPCPYASRGEGQGLVVGDDPYADDAGFLALFFLGGVVGVRHRGEGAEGHGYFHGVRTDGGTFAEDFVALDRAEVAFVTPIGDEVFHAVTGFGLPEFVGFLGIAGDQSVEEALGRALFGIVAEGKPEHDSNDQNQRNTGEN